MAVPASARTIHCPWPWANPRALPRWGTARTAGHRFRLRRSSGAQPPHGVGAAAWQASSSLDRSAITDAAIHAVLGVSALMVPGDYPA